MSDKSAQATKIATAAKASRDTSALVYDFDQSVGFWLATTHQTYMRAFQETLSPHGITYRQAQVLGWLAAEGPLSQRELAERMLIEPPNLVGVLNRMEGAGLIERGACASDRRKNTIRPLPAALTLWRKIAACGRQIRERAVEGLKPAEREQLKKLLAKVRDNLSNDPHGIA
ncbi:MarR family winged helix-turn-helix transcriptional regulator [Botrimarina hoheduenensis]|uniref:HTH-type transcriptional repressor NicR n=1 Tax=Botrimarina hoheduenensis TaxID=2528000 RepID=A0A5C5VXG0_9BACT|nr:MarR family winged helix-turn-helix transcriptional regulator [Botrimarina hoheduenensis]TWT43134.1 HTH-type transcriptional repressor NicR [Botrimarina hoheduenensis]